MVVPSSPASPLSEASFSPPTVAETEAVLTQVGSVIEAELVRGRLEAAGIQARLTDTHTAGLGPHLTMALGGIRVIVHRDDVEAARAILDDIAPLVEDDDDDEPAAMISRGPADTAARWSLWSAILSGPFPFVGHFCSVLVAMRALTHEDALTATGRRNVGLAIAIDVATAVVWWRLLW